MKNPDLVKQWLKRASSNLERARTGRTSNKILYEDLCFDIQQSAEKLFKALLISRNIRFSYTH